MLDTGYWILDAGCWMLDAGCWILVTGCWMLVTGYWLLVTGYWSLDFTILLLIQLPTSCNVLPTFFRLPHSPNSPSISFKLLWITSAVFGPKEFSSP